MILLVSCSSQKLLSEQILKNKTIEEISKLNSLNSKGYITEADFTKINILTANDSYATDEINEIRTLVKYREYYHVFHGLGFLQEYIKSGKETICPGHSLSHYYVFIKHNETELAEENFNSAVDTLSTWMPLASAYNEKEHFVEDFNATVERIKKDIENIKNGNTSASDDEIEWLSTDASICVDNPN